MKTWKWVVSLFNGGDLHSGTRVRTKYGRGVILSGSINIKYDPGTKLPGVTHENELVRSDNLNNIHIEIL
jgi:hypothetical protein